MNKNIIRQKLREGAEKLQEWQPRLKQQVQQSQGLKKPKDEKSLNKNSDKEYADIQNALEDTLLTKSQVMSAAGLGNSEDAGDRKAFNAKLDKEETESGGKRHFNDMELAKVAKVVSNPMAYIHNSKGKNSK